MSVTDPIRNKEDLQALAEYYLNKQQYRNYCLIVLGTTTALRITDLLQLRWQDVYNEQDGQYLKHIVIKEQKTKKNKTIILHPQAIKALDLLKHRSKAHGLLSGYIFSNNRGNCQPISRVQAWRIISDAAKKLDLPGNITCHSLRKTWGYHAWASGKVSPVVIMHIYNHSNFAITQRYLGIEQDDLDEAYLKMNLFAK